MFRKEVLAALCLGGLACAQQEKVIDSIHIRQGRIVKQTKTSTIISRANLDNSTGENLANVLKNVSGVNLLQSGANISKPVIQGLTNQRIAIINNGVKL